MCGISGLCGMWQLCVGGQNSSRVPLVHLILSCALIIFLKMAQSGEVRTHSPWKHERPSAWSPASDFCKTCSWVTRESALLSPHGPVPLRFCDSSSTSLSPTGSLVNNSWTEAVKLIPGRDFFHWHHMVSCDVPITHYGGRMQRRDQRWHRVSRPRQEARPFCS